MTVRAPSSDTVVRTIRRDAAFGVTASKRRQLTELGHRFSRGRIHYIRAYWHPSHVEGILVRPRELVEQRRRAGWLAADLSAHQNKVCLETTLGILRGSWRSTIHRAVVQVHRDEALSREERELALRTLRTPHLLQACVLGQFDAMSDPAHLRLWRRLRRLVLRTRGRRPRLGSRVWFELDCNLYRAFRREEDGRFRGAWLVITGLAPRQRICVPLSGSSLDEFASRTSLSTSGPTIRVVVDQDRVTFFVLGRGRVAARQGSLAGGVDKGFNTLITPSTGRPETSVAYGPGAGDLITVLNAAPTLEQWDPGRCSEV